MRTTTKQGALIGLMVGLIALAIALLLAIQCLPFRIAALQPAPWYCTDPAYVLFGYLAFPANVLTNDLSRAIWFAPLSLLLYVGVGAFIGSRR
jgi:hypothetical protein